MRWAVPKGVQGAEKSHHEDTFCHFKDWELKEALWLGKGKYYAHLQKGKKEVSIVSLTAVSVVIMEQVYIEVTSKHKQHKKKEP